MAFCGPVQDRMLIRERMESYADATFRRDAEAWLANWTDDAVWTLPIGRSTGKAELHAQWNKVWATQKRMAFFTQPGAIEVDGETAIARSYCREIVILNDGTVKKLVGAYRDRLVLVNGAWLFAERDYGLHIRE